MSLTRLLLIEDEPAIAENVLFPLKAAHFDPVWCATGTEGLAVFAEAPFAFVILDIGLPDQSGFDVCWQIRSVSRLSVLFLSARRVTGPGANVLCRVAEETLQELDENPGGFRIVAEALGGDVMDHLNTLFRKWSSEKEGRATA